MKKAEYKYQKYNKGFYYAEALLTTYNSSMRAIANKSYNSKDITFCQVFENTVMHLYTDFKDKSGVWNYILFNEYVPSVKSCSKKRLELEQAGLPISRASYYREKVLFTNLIAEYFNLGTEYVKYKCDADSETLPTPDKIKDYIINLKAA